nr:immunoglobulin heavy chain junction region [Macaca mulatta]MOV46196.1 immunoglobulin heavy chain junction region [Macaca mulatta]MOV47103.1 immunoglobulin heavy chain junction region [Macaca mulatta]
CTRAPITAVAFFDFW